MKKIFLIITLVLFNLCLFAQLDSKLNIYVKQTFLKSSTTKIQLVGKFPKCGYNEVYFIQGYNKNKKLVERFLIYKKGVAYYKTNELIIWGANDYRVQYGIKDSIEEKSDLKNFIVTFKNGKFTFINKPQQVINAEKSENPTEENIVELPTSMNATFDEFLTQNDKCK